MKLRKSKKGFTLAELLIVVAIIAILVAIAIPVFTNQLNNARHAVDVANVRAAYSEAAANYLLSAGTGTPVTTTASALATAAGVTSSDVTLSSTTLTVATHGQSTGFTVDTAVVTG